MKQLLTYISPDKDFNEEHQKLVKIQIDNSLELGWKPSDIMLVTNFHYRYNGVKSRIIGDKNYCYHHWPATKIYVIDYLFMEGLIDDLFWYHDFDCYQLHPFTEDILGEADMGLAQYGRSLRLCSASIFFKETAVDIFSRWKDLVALTKIDEELGIMRLINNDTGNLKNRVKKINTTYAFHKFNLLKVYEATDKPIKVAHFHFTPDKVEFYMKGKNELNRPLLPERLIEIFDRYE